MSEQEISESDKLIIVESGKNRRGASAASSSGFPASFTRQVVGRHVIYKSDDGVKLCSLAEARRYFKQKGQVLVEAQFDFSPPAVDIEAKKRAISLDSTSPTTSKGVRGRPKQPAVNSPKTSPAKSTALARRKELVDDLITIRESLKDDENEGNDLETPSTSGTRNKVVRGRPKRKNQSQIEVQEDSEDAVSAKPDTPSDGMLSPKDEPSPEDNKGRPTRQRRPNQRYTDLISESESSRKKPRKDSGGAESSIRRDLSEKISPMARMFAMPGATATKTSTSTRSRKDFPRKVATPRQSKPSHRPPKLVDESDSRRSNSLSPLPAGGFEAPPEFMDIHENPSPQEASVPRVLPTIPPPSIPSSSLLYTPPVSTSSNMARTIQPTIAPTNIAPTYKRLEMESIPKQMEPIPKRYRSYDKPNSPRMISPVDQRQIIKPVRRGRKPAGEASPFVSDPWPKFGHHMADETISGRRAEAATRRYDYGSQDIRSSRLSPDIDAQSHFNTNVVSGYYTGPRGLAKLQRGSSKRMTIGRYGAASSAAAVILQDPPPQLELYGGGEPVIEKKPGKVQQKGARQSDVADPTLFCHLPPEIMGDHCYGRQPDPPPSAGQKVVGQSVSSATKTGNGQPYGSPPPPLLRVESQRRSLQNERSSQNFGSTSPSNQFQRYRSTSTTFASYQNFGSDLGSSSGAGASTTLGGQQMLGDKLPANILEEDDGDNSGELVTSVSIH